MYREILIKDCEVKHIEYSSDRIVQNSRCSMLEDLVSPHVSRHNQRTIRVMIDDRINTLIVSAGTLSDSMTAQIECFDWNLKCIERFTENKKSGYIIVLGSTAYERGYPQHPLYAAFKGALRSYCKSLPDEFRVYYLVIPSTKTDMCDHGLDPHIILDTIIDITNGKFK